MINYQNFSKIKITQRLKAAYLKRASARIKDINSKSIHIDDWLDYPGKEFYTPQPQDNDKLYAKFVLDYMRMPAYKISGYERFMKQFNLYCTFNNERYRVTMASRLGTIGLRKDFNTEHGYDICAYPNECTNWSNKP